MIELVPVTSVYGGLFALLIITLAFRVVSQRRSQGVGIGDGGNDGLNLAIRAHANAIEYIPIGLILLLLLEMNGARAMILHGLGSALLVARVLHAWGLSQSGGRTFGRFYGTLVTWIVILAAGILNILL